MKPDWKNAPDWAQWLAMDNNGDWYWYENKPIAGMNYWHPQGECRRADDNSWQDSLEKRP